MPQLNPLVLKDGAATPVDHTFTPRTVENGVATLVESAGSPLGERRLSFSQNRSSSGRIRVIAKLAIPVVQDVVVNGVTKPTLVRTNYADITFNFDNTSSNIERRDIVAEVASMLGATQTMVRSYIVDLEGLY